MIAQSLFGIDLKVFEFSEVYLLHNDVAHSCDAF